MNVTLIVVVILLFQTPSPKKTDKEIAGLIGSVRSVRTEIARISKEGDKWVEGKRFAPRVVVYDVDGHITGAAEFMDDKNLVSKTAYSNDGEGNRIEKTIINKSNGSQETLSVKYSYQYDVKGNRVEEIRHFGDGRSKTTYKFDDKNTLVEVTELSPNPPHSKCVETYDGKGPQRDRVCFDKTGALALRVSYSYEFDSTGNWVKRVENYVGMKDGKEAHAGRTAIYRTIKYAASPSDFLSKSDDIPDQINPLPARPLVIRKSSGVLAGTATKRVEPTYPQSAIAAGVKGSVQVEVTLNEAGRVEKVVVLSGPKELHSAVVEAVKQWEFKPTSLSGTAVKVIGIMTFNFNL